MELINGNIQNCYSIGRVLSGNNFGAIVGSVENNGTVSNCFYLQGAASGGIGISNTTTAEDKTGSVEVKTSSELKELYKTLGTEFKKDIGSTNDGYPILSWQ